MPLTLEAKPLKFLHAFLVWLWLTWPWICLTSFCSPVPGATSATAAASSESRSLAVSGYATVISPSPLRAPSVTVTLLIPVGGLVGFG